VSGARLRRPVAGSLAESKESQNRENHNDHADQPEILFMGRQRRGAGIGRFHEHPRPLTCPGRLPDPLEPAAAAHGTAYPAIETDRQRG